MNDEAQLARRLQALMDGYQVMTAAEAAAVAGQRAP